MKLPVPSQSSRQIADCVRLACLIEAAARKPGNVHPEESFADLCHRDFVLSAETIAPLLGEVSTRGVGATVLEAVRQTQAAVGRNTNLGIVLLLTPLAAVPLDVPLSEGIAGVLSRLTRDDARLAYRAIREACAGGLGTAAEEDVAGEPSGTLLDVMRLAAGRDAVAAQYANGFDLVLNVGLPLLTARADFADRWEQAVIGLHLELMARSPDTLIARKCGAATARQSSRLARAILEAGWPDTAAGRFRLEQFDRWLREDGHRRNPGTTADLVAASLFAALRDGRIGAPRGIRRPEASEK